MEENPQPTSQTDTPQVQNIPSAPSLVGMTLPDLIKAFGELSNAFNALRQAYYLNNFPGHQDFNKSVNFTSKLKVPHYASAPATAEVGEVIEISGILYICSAANTFTKVGTQT